MTHAEIMAQLGRSDYAIALARVAHVEKYYDRLFGALHNMLVWPSESNKEHARKLLEEIREAVHK